MHGNFAVHINNQLLFLKNRLFFFSSSIVHFNATEILIVYKRSKWILSWQEVGREQKKEMVLKQHTGQQSADRFDDENTTMTVPYNVLYDSAFMISRCDR